MSRVFISGSVGVVLSLVVLFGLMRETGSAATPLTIRTGTAVPKTMLTEQDREMLASAGATDGVSLLGTRGDRSYYSIPGASGGTCYAVGSLGSGLVGISCLQNRDNVPFALIDMSTAVMYPKEGLGIRLTRVEGVAADQVATVGIEALDGSLESVPVADNVYRIDSDQIPQEARAIVALDAGGRVLYRKPVGGS